MSMEPCPEAQAAFMKADLWFLENVVKRAHHWAPIVAGFLLILHFIKPLDIVFQAMIMSGYVWVALNSDERTAALRWLANQAARLKPKVKAKAVKRPNSWVYDSAESFRQPSIAQVATAPRGLLGQPTLTPPKKAINVLGAFVRVIGFVWKYRKLILIGLVLAFLFLGVGPLMRACTTLPFGIGESREELRAERDDALHEADMRQIEGDIAVNVAIPGAERTHRVERAVERTIEQAESDITHAVADQDFDRVFASYRDAYERVWNDSGDTSAPAPDAPRLRGMLPISAG